MPYAPTVQTLSFVWLPLYYTSSVAELVRKKKISVIVDVTGLSIDRLARDIQDMQGAELKLSLEQFFSPAVLGLLQSIQTKVIWVEFFEHVSSCKSDLFLQRVSAYDFLNCNVITGDLSFIHTCFQQVHDISGLAIKGSESSGFVSSETILTLLSHLETLPKNNMLVPKIHVWGGIFTPEGAVACLVSGVSRVVFESLHWLTDKMLGVNDNLSKSISQLRLDHTSAVELEKNLYMRVFDKGNSVAVKKIKHMVQDDSGVPHITNKVTALISAQIIPPLMADFDEQQLIPLGPEAVFADSFVHRFGRNTLQALYEFSAEIDRISGDFDNVIPQMFDGEICGLLGVQYPFIQGAMAWISDIPQFALSIAKAGGLPTIAMGIKSIAEIEKDLSILAHVLDGYSYAVNVITLPENPYLTEQLAWIEKNPPPFVVISAGDPAYAARLQQKGVAVIYVTADVDLLQMAWNKGIRVVVCEGQEAGGHVGVHSTLTLAQAVLGLKSGKETKRTEQFLVLAGGICSTNSLARAALLGADGVQMGTYYLFSEEAVSSGAMSKLYQQSLIEASFGDTLLTGDSVGLRVRSISSPKTEKIRALEKEFSNQSTHDTDIRQQLEETTVGSLLIAARNLHPESGEQLSEETCYQEGQFMSGAIAGDLHDVFPVWKLHQMLSGNEFRIQLPHSPRPNSVTAMPGGDINVRERIAITGMAAVNSLGNSPEEIWQACLAMESGITELPEQKWNHKEIYNTDFSNVGGTYCNVGAFLSLDISRKELGISPHDFRTMAASTKLTLWLAHRAIKDSNIINSEISRHRIGVIVSQNAGEFGSTTTSLTIATEAGRIADLIGKSGDFAPDQIATMKQAIKSGHLEIDDTTLLGRLNCAAAGFICNKYGFRGPSCSVTTACASSLTAVFNAVQLMRGGVLDAAVVGGGEELISKASYLEFSALGALAGKGYDNEDPAAFSRPFDKERSGMVLGEGGGLIVIERESVARKRGAPILAYITGVGASNNDQGMVESVSDIQKIAISNSFEEAGYGSDQVDMVECHATSTNLGDLEEVKALKEIYPPRNSVVLSSFKSQIGHTLGASGISSLIRGICSMRAGIFPPTLNYDNPDPTIGLEDAGFRVCRKPEPWPCRSDRPRRFEVNAFGFGGANYVIQLEDCSFRKQEASVVSGDYRPESELTDFANSTLFPGASFFSTQITGQELRVGVTDDQMSRRDVENVLESYKQDLGHLSLRQQRNLTGSGISVDTVSEELPLALVFAGQGTHYPQMGKKLYRTFPLMRQWMDTLADLADFDLLHILFQEDVDALKKTQCQQPALFLLEYALYKQLDAFGLQPVAMAGHSMGELTALCVAGCFSYEDGFKIINKRAQLMAKAAEMTIDPGTMLAVNAPESYLCEELGASEKLFITNFNSPRQTVVGGSILEIEKLKSRLDKHGYWNVQLPVSMAFHSPVMKIIRDELNDYIAEINIQSPRIPVISNSTCVPYPDDSSEIKRTIISHLETPVHWQSNVLSLINDFGCRLFLEIGPQDSLCSLIRECAENVHCLNSCSARDEVETLKKSVAALFVKGGITPADISEIYLQDGSKGEGGGISREAVMDIIQEEVYSFALHGTEKYLKPSIIKKIQRKIDPNFQPDDLAGFMPDNFARSPVFPAPVTGFSTSISSNDVTIRKIIQIIIDVTGYTRDEIKPQMDLKDDLAVRPDHLPIIVGEINKSFNTKLSAEDFLAVGTIQELADLLTEGMRVDGADGASRNEVLSATEFMVDSTSSEDAILEKVIQIIMNTTGYERDEISPEMDVRDDLSIKSSRIPLIVDAAEKTFNITTSLEDFFSVRTVKDLADRVAELMEDGGKAVAEMVQIEKPMMYTSSRGRSIVSSPERGINRLIYKKEKIDWPEQKDLDIVTGSRILLLSLTDEHHSGEVRDSLEKEYQAEVISLQIDKDSSRDGAVNLFDLDKVRLICEKLSDEGPLAGIILISDHQVEERLTPQEVGLFVTGFFILFQYFLQSPKRQFTFHLHFNNPENPAESLLRQSILGLLLTVAIEYKALCIRSMKMDANSDMSSVLIIALNVNNRLVDLMIENKQLYSNKAALHAILSTDQPALKLLDEDVLVLTGGGRGVTSYIARAFAGFGCKIILLGCTAPDPSIVFDDKLADPKKEEAFISNYLRENYDRLSLREQKRKRKEIKKSLEIQRTLTELKQLGVKAEYISCDVTSKIQVTAVIDDIANRYGKIDGIIHGAGITKDSYIPLVKPVSFKKVMDVKLLGAVHLLEATKDKGLRFAIALSSIAAAAGNIGQASYCVANRAMSAYFHMFKNCHEDIVTKVFWLPPIEGAGMADNPEIKDILQQNMGDNIFLEVHESSEIILRELLCGPAEDCWVIPLRDITASDTVLFDPVVGNNHWFSYGNLPMIGSVEKLDLRKKTLHACRTINTRQDLWLNDHRPTKLLKHPILSAIMAIETFLETSTILFPHLQVIGLKNVMLERMVQCPAEKETEIHFFCEVDPSETSQQVCNVELKLVKNVNNEDSDPIFDTYFRGQVLNRSYRPSLGRHKLEIDGTVLCSHQKVIELYEKYSALKNRYQVIDSIISCRRDRILGKMIYPEVNDFSDTIASHFQYPHYLLEALMQISFFFTGIQHKDESYMMIPNAMNSIFFSRHGNPGEELFLEGWLLNEDPAGARWDLMGVDREGAVVMKVNELQMKKVS